MKVMWMAAAAVLMSATGALAADQDKDKEEAPAQEKVQCRYEKVTGSRTKSYRICLTKSEWRQRTTDEQEELNRMQGAGANIGASSMGGSAN